MTKALARTGGAGVGILWLPAVTFGWGLYGRLNETTFRKIVLVLLLLSGIAIVAALHRAL